MKCYTQNVMWHTGCTFAYNNFTHSVWYYAQFIISHIIFFCIWAHNVSLRCFVPRQLLSRICALSGVKFPGLKLRLCKKIDKYEVCACTGSKIKVDTFFSTCLYFFLLPFCIFILLPPHSLVILRFLYNGEGGSNNPPW